MRTYLFDIGNVLLAFDFQPALESLTGPNASSTAIQEIITEKDKFEAGKVSTTEYINWASNLLDFNGSHDEFKRAWSSIFTPIEGTWLIAKQLYRDGHRLILFSNTNAIHAPYCLATYPEFSLFEHAAFSFEIGEIKPNKEFYTQTFKRFDIDPLESYYIDDLAENIDTGKALGLNTHHYSPSNHQALIEWLKHHD